MKWRNHPYRRSSPDRANTVARGKNAAARLARDQTTRGFIWSAAASGHGLADCRSADAFHPDDASSDACAGSYSYSVLRSLAPPFGHSIGPPTDFAVLRLPSMRRSSGRCIQVGYSCWPPCVKQRYRCHQNEPNTVPRTRTAPSAMTQVTITVITMSK